MPSLHLWPGLARSQALLRARFLLCRVMATEPKRRAFADTAVGKISIGATIAAASALLTVAVTWVTAPQPEPTLSIEPSEASVEAGRTIEFIATGLPSLSGSDITLEWRVSGAPLKNNPIGSCETRQGATLISCRLALPGIFSVTLRGSNDEGYQAAAVASVQVVGPGAYVAVALARVHNAEAAYRALLNTVDWIKVQESTPRPIVLYDPDVGAPIFAVSYKRRQIVDIDAGSLAGVSISVWSEAYASAGSLVEPLEALGASVHFVSFGTRPDQILEPSILNVKSLEEFEQIFKNTQGF